MWCGVRVRIDAAVSQSVRSASVRLWPVPGITRGRGRYRQVLLRLLRVGTLECGLSSQDGCCLGRSGWWWRSGVEEIQFGDTRQHIRKIYWFHFLAPYIPRKIHGHNLTQSFVNLVNVQAKIIWQWKCICSILDHRRRLALHDNNCGVQCTALHTY